MDGVNLRSGSGLSGQQVKTKSQNINQKKVNELQNGVENLNSQLESLNLSVRFGYNSKVNFLYVQLIDTKTNRVIKQEPSDNFLKLKEVINNLIQDSLKELRDGGDLTLKSDDTKQKKIVNEINDTLKPVNGNVEFKYIDGELTLIEKATGEILTKLDEEQVEKLTQHMEDFINFIGLSFDKKI